MTMQARMLAALKGVMDPDEFRVVCDRDPQGYPEGLCRTEFSLDLAAEIKALIAEAEHTGAGIGDARSNGVPASDSHSAPTLHDAISRMTAWVRDYGDQCQTVFVEDFRAVVAAAKRTRRLEEALRGCMAFIDQLRTPQTIQEAAAQVMAGERALGFARAILETEVSGE